jgi:hypothetical protein
MCLQPSLEGSQNFLFRTQGKLKLLVTSSHLHSGAHQGAKTSKGREQAPSKKQEFMIT